MSYYPTENSPRGTQQYDDYGIPDYHEQDVYRQPRQMQPPQGRRAPPRGYGPDPRMRFPHPQAYPRAQPPTSSGNLYDGSEYGEPEFDQQWPLDTRDMSQARGSAHQQGAGRGGPPPRPARPDYVPPNFEPPRQPPRVAPANRQYQQQPPPNFQHGTGEWTGDGYSIPSAPPAAMPQVQGHHLAQQPIYNQAPRRPPLGPPPSSRRGPSSYYSQISSVHPIVEETDSMRGSMRGGSRASFASSNAIPIGIPDYYLQDRDSAVPSLPPTTPGSDYPPEDSPIAPVPPLRPDLVKRHVPEEPYQHNVPLPPEREDSPVEAPALVRQASIGKRSKPTLTTVKSGDRLRKDSNPPPPSAEGLSSLPSQQRRDPPVESLKEIPIMYQKPRSEPSEKDVEAGAMADAPQYEPSNESPTAPHSRETSTGRLASGTGFIDTSSDSEKSIKKPVKKISSKELLGAQLPSTKQSRTRERSPLAPRDSDDEYDDPRIKEVLGSLEKGGALTPQRADTLKLPSSGMAELRAGKKRPPRLNVDSVRDAEARGSLTSLPDLIKRATKLASNLDRGKTASRLGMSQWLDGSNGNLAEKHRSDYRKSNGSISDMLNSFPPPGLPTPPGSRHEMRRSMTTWSSHLRHSALPSDSDAGAQNPGKSGKRRCCGMPMWLFIVTLILLLLLVAAAVIVPVVLIVLPKQHNSSAATCAKELTCQNGGQAVSLSGTCSCVCVNGFTGTTCGTQSQAGCTTISAGSTSDATVGDSIPRILSGAQRNFSIPLDAQTLLGIFNNEDLSCSSENALITFNNAASRRTLLPTPILVKRIPQATTAQPAAAVTSNGIVFESGTAPPAAASASSTSTPSSATPSSTPSPNTPSSDSRTSTAHLDFARSAILYILQSSSQLSFATTAQSNFQSYFNTGATANGAALSAKNVSLGNGFSADLESYYIVGGSGGRVGGGPGE